MDTYGNLFYDLDKNTIKNGSKLLDENNNLYLLFMVVYSYKESVDLKECLRNMQRIIIHIL